MNNTPGNDAQRPLIDVARSYCKNLNSPSTSKISNHGVPGLSNEIKENASFSATKLAYSVHPFQGSEYTWQANTDSGNKKVFPASGPTNPYSWKAPSSTKATVFQAVGNAPRADTYSPRPRIPLPKLEPLTMSVSKDFNSRSVKETPKQSPLQPFSPTGNSRECTCLRNPKVILCQSCGFIQKGRLSMTCLVHPRKVFLMDIKCCSGCKSTNLKEICDAKKVV